MHRCYAVTPHAGVWIETLYIQGDEEKKTVTPHAGVWIETRKARSKYCSR